MKFRFKLIFFVALLSVFGSSFLITKEVGAVGLTVKRVIFEGSKRAEVITVINNSDQEETYRMGWRHYVMDENKSLKAVSEGALPAAVKPAKEMIRFSPRRFTLPARGSQQVRMMLRLPAGVADGEYRSHLWIRPEADVEAFKKEAEKGTKEGKVGVAVKMLAGVSMPIIVRKGALEGSAEITSLDIRDVGTHIEANYVLERKGQRSVYGDLDLICNMGSPDEYLTQFLRGIAIYPEISRRNLMMKVKYRADKPKCNSITMRYSETEGFMGDVVSILSERTATVQ